MSESEQKISVHISEIKHGMQWAISNSPKTLYQAVKTVEQAKQVYFFYTGRDTEMDYDGIMQELVMLLEGKHNDSKAKAKLASLRQNGNPDLNFIIEELNSKCRVQSIDYLYSYFQVLGCTYTKDEVLQKISEVVDERLAPGSEAEVAINTAANTLKEIVKFREETNINCRMYLVSVKLGGYEYGVATVFFNNDLRDHKAEKFLYLDNITKFITPITIWYLCPHFRPQLPSLLGSITKKLKELAHKLHCKSIYTSTNVSMIEPYKSHGFEETHEKMVDFPCSVNFKPDSLDSILLAHHV